MLTLQNFTASRLEKKRNVVAFSLNRRCGKLAMHLLLPNRRLHSYKPCFRAVQEPVTSRSFGDVLIDNKSHSNFTVLTLEGKDQPGLLRMATWVLNGLGITVQNSKIDTSENGYVKDVFWLTDFREKKLSDQSASSLSERLVDFLSAIQPAARAGQPRQEWKYCCVEISNVVHPTCTQLLITGEPEGHKPGFLFDIVTVLSSIGTTIKEGIVQGSADHPSPIAPEGYDFAAGGRCFKFLLADHDGCKLDPSRVEALIFALDLVTGRGHLPTVPPNLEVLLRS